MTAAAFKADLVAITRKRFSISQGEVLVEYNGVRIEQYGDKISINPATGEWVGNSDAFWVSVARREAIARGLASEPTSPAPGKVVINTTADFTPAGKRSARIVETSGRLGAGRQFRWYVSGRIYRRLAVTPANVALTNEWLAA